MLLLGTGLLFAVRVLPVATPLRPVLLRRILLLLPKLLVLLLLVLLLLLLLLEVEALI